MALIDWSVKHVATKSAMPQTLKKGRAYFVDDEGCIIIDHGNGPVTYGAKKQTDANTTAIGDITSLTTTDKTSLTGAVNELSGKFAWAEDEA